MPVDTIIQIRKGSSSTWISTNPVLASGEPGYDTTNNLLKIGDGLSTWINLPSANILNSNFNSAVSGLLPITNITAGTNVSVSSSGGNYTVNSTQIVSYATTASFPATGSSTTYYLASDTGRMYQWTGSYYAEIGPPISSVNNAQNAANLYLWSNFK